jgi:nicotinate-nucleotide pyrophosphorylase
VDVIHSSSDDDNGSQPIEDSSQTLFPVDRENGVLSAINLAFASWSWTHGISIEAYNSLQQLLHSDIIVPLDGLLHSLHGVRKHVLRFLQLSAIHTLSIKLKASKLPSRTSRSRSDAPQATVATYAKSTLFAVY